MLLWIFWPELQTPQGWCPTHFSGGKILICWLWPQSLLEITLSVMDNSNTTLKCSTAVGISCKNLFFLFVMIWYIFLIFLKNKVILNHLKSVRCTQTHCEWVCMVACVMSLSSLLLELTVTNALIFTPFFVCVLFFLLS